MYRAQPNDRKRKLASYETSELVCLSVCLSVCLFVCLFAGIGFLLAALSVVVAGVVEIARKDRMHEAHGVHMQELGGEKFNASDLSVFAQVSEYALVGASEVFASICGT